MFGPATYWGKQSVVVYNSRQYTLDKCSGFINHGQFSELEKAAQRAADLPFGEANKLEFESRGVASTPLNLEDDSAWEIISQSMIMQE